MGDKITLETLAYFISWSLLFNTFIWGVLYIILLRKFNAVYLMFEALAKGISGQHGDIVSNQKNLHKNLSDQHTILAKSIEEKEEQDENNYH